MSTATAQSIWDEGMDDIPPDVLDQMAYERRIWVLQEKPGEPYQITPSNQAIYAVIKRGEYRAVNAGDGRHFIIEGRIAGRDLSWTRVGHIVK